MKSFVAFAAAGLGLFAAASFAGAQEIETFDSPNLTQIGGGNFAFNMDGPPAGGGYVDNATNMQVNDPSGYWTGYYNFYTQDTRTAINISGSSDVQLDVTIPSGDAGIFLDLLDGSNNFVQYFWGYGLTGTAANDQGGLPAPGYTITQGAAPNEIILDAPISLPFNQLSGSGFNSSALVLFRLEDDPGSGKDNVVEFNDLSAVNVPEPASLGMGAAALALFARRRRR